jgi:hypothetical protein
MSEPTSPNELIATNAGRRLYVILRAIKDNRTSGTIASLLERVLHVPSGDVAALYRQYASLLTLVADVKNRLVALEDADKKHYLTCFAGIEKAFYTASLQQSEDNLRKTLTDSDLSLLFLAAQRLDAVQVEVLLPSSEIAALQNDVNGLFQTIANGQLPSDVRIIILDLLEAIRRTLGEYQIRGAEGLKRVLAESLGRLVLDKDVVVKSKETPDFKAFMDLLTRLNALFQAATNSTKIGMMIGDVVAKLQG